MNSEGMYCNMSKQSSRFERLRRALTTPTHGVLGSVDELLTTSHEYNIRLGWEAGRCRVSALNADPPDQIDVPMQKSVIRAALARVAALCNERIPNCVSPYGGLGEMTIDADPAKVIRVKFVNTPEEQSLELVSVQLEGIQQAAGQSLAVKPVASTDSRPLTPDY